MGIHNESVRELSDRIDFTARRGMIRLGKLVTKFDKRELGGITFRIKQTSKNSGTYRFFRVGEGELLICRSIPKPATNSEGCRDDKGSFSILNVGEKNAHEKK